MTATLALVSAGLAVACLRLWAAMQDTYRELRSARLDLEDAEARVEREHSIRRKAMQAAERWRAERDDLAAILDARDQEAHTGAQAGIWRGADGGIDLARRAVPFDGADAAISPHDPPAYGPLG